MRRTILPVLRRQTALGPRIYWRGLSTGARYRHIPNLSNVAVLTRCGAVPDAATRTVGVVATDGIAADFAQRAAAGGHTLRVALGPGAPDGMPHSNHAKQHTRVNWLKFIGLFIGRRLALFYGSATGRYAGRTR